MIDFILGGNAFGHKKQEVQFHYVDLVDVFSFADCDNLSFFWTRLISYQKCHSLSHQSWVVTFVNLNQETVFNELVTADLGHYTLNVF